MGRDKRLLDVVIRRIVRADEAPLAALFASIAADDTATRFHPHPFTPDAATRIAGHAGKDIYLAAFDGATPVAYGMLRGWDEGYAVPSLGIYVATSARGTGVARQMMVALHEHARDAGARRIRLKVYPDNNVAYRLYESLGYVFDTEDAGQRVGLLDLPNQKDHGAMSFKYPVYTPYFSGREKELVLECLDSTWISSKGKYIGEFENRFAKWLGVDHALSVSNGTVALHVALAALGIGAGDEVIVPTLTYIASANAVAYTGAKVVFVDSKANDWQIDVKDIERKITPRTKAIMPVHLYGQACDMDAIMALAEKYSLYVIEDCAEAIGTRYKGRFVGSFGHVNSFSFFGNKTITTGEGGMVVSNDPQIADRVAHLKGQGLARDREYWHDVIGFNYRMTNICAAIGCAQMDSIDDVIAKKQQIARWYRDALADAPVQMHGTNPDTEHSYWMVSILVNDAAQRDPLRAALKAQGIETRPLFYPVHQMHMYKTSESFPVAENLAYRGLNLPSYPALTKENVQEIASAVQTFLAHKGNA